MAERDTQKSKLYKAERESVWPISKDLGTTDGVLHYLIKELGRQTLRRRYGIAVDLKQWPLAVKDGRGTRNGLAYGSTTISLPAGWARREAVALHEAAHIIHARLAYGGPGERSTELRGGASHGWQFAAIELDLVRFIMGKEAADALKTAFRKNRVRFKPKRKSTRTGINPFIRNATQED